MSPPIERLLIASDFRLVFAPSCPRRFTIFQNPLTFFLFMRAIFRQSVDPALLVFKLFTKRALRKVDQRLSGPFDPPFSKSLAIPTHRAPGLLSPPPQPLPSRVSGSVSTLS